VATGPMPYQDTSTYGQDKASETNELNSNIAPNTGTNSSTNQEIL